MLATHVQLLYWKHAFQYCFIDFVQFDVLGFCQETSTPAPPLDFWENIKVEERNDYINDTN
jgi:hypothetical protein